ncbi:MAG: flavodoxin [Firmicutes bacterium]|nr:flavodoxin [Bacillota bacterium]
MKVAIRYYSKTGHTKKIMDAISTEIGVPALEVSTPLEEKVDILFLGNAVYAAGLDKRVVKFLEENKDKIGTIVNVSSASAITSTINMVKKVADANGICLSEKEFHCKGQFGPLHRGRPNQKDLKNAANFAKSVLK